MAAEWTAAERAAAVAQGNAIRTQVDELIAKIPTAGTQNPQPPGTWGWAGLAAHLNELITAASNWKASIIAEIQDVE